MHPTISLCFLCRWRPSYAWKNSLMFFFPPMLMPFLQLIKRIRYPQDLSYDALIWQLLMNLSEKLTYLAHNGLSCGKAISSHGFALPLKWMTPALSASAKIVFSWYPNPSMCQKGSMMWTWPWNAINPGGNVPSCHKLRSDFIFYMKGNRDISVSY